MKTERAGPIRPSDSATSPSAHPMETTKHTVITRSGSPAEIAISPATTDRGERIFIVHVLSGPIANLTDISAWEVPPARTEAARVDADATKVAVDHISHIVAEPMEGMPVPEKTAP